MKFLKCLLAGLLALALSAPVEAATKYIKPTGNDALDGTSLANAYKTWSKAFSSTNCGDTLVAGDGTYTSANTPTILTKVCPPASPYTVIAQNERAAFIDASSGSFLAFKILNSSYITVQGFRMKSGDLSLANGAANGGILNVYNSNHITLRRNLVYNTNRYLNAGHAIQCVTCTFSTIEENEVLDFHRHGVFLGTNSDDNVVARNYCNGRGYADIQGSSVENPVDGPSEYHADDCYIVYPGSRNLFINNIAEGDMLKCHAEEAIGALAGNKWLGNICFGGAWNGYAFDARLPNSSTNMPKDTLVENGFVQGTNNHSISGQTATSARFNGNKNTIVRNTTIMDSWGGFEFDRLSGVPGDGVYSATLDRVVALRVLNSYGVRFSSLYTWTGTNNLSYQSALGNYNPSTSSNYSPNPQVSQDPGFGSCWLWAPDGSYAALNNLGARILYRYDATGVVTQERLWDQTTAEFPHGAVVTGINDSTGSSVSTVHNRLHVNTPDCPFPSGYVDLGSGPSDPTTHHIFTGSSAVTGNITVPAGLRYLALFAILRDSNGNAGQLSSISIDCGSKSFTNGFRVKSNVLTGYHDVEGWILQNPTAGSCVFTGVVSGAMTSWIIDIFELTTGTGVTWASTGSAGVVGSHPSVSISSSTANTVYNVTSGSSAYTLVPGAGQTLIVDQASGAVRMAVSSQTGAVSTTSQWDFGGTTYWASGSLNVQQQTSQPPSKPVGLSVIRR